MFESKNPTQWRDEYESLLIHLLAVWLPLNLYEPIYLLNMNNGFHCQFLCVFLNVGSFLSSSEFTFVAEDQSFQNQIPPSGQRQYF